MNLDQAKARIAELEHEIADLRGLAIAGEEWRPVRDFEGRYEVSDRGRVRSLDRIVTSPSGRVRHERGRVLALCKLTLGYLRFAARANDGSQRMILAHRLVAETFLPNPHNHPVVNHKDHDRSNNSVTNLEWVDVLGNVHHARDAGRYRGRRRWDNDLRVTAFGRTQRLTDWCKELGKSQHKDAIYCRLRVGVAPEVALMAPMAQGGRRLPRASDDSSAVK